MYRQVTIFQTSSITTISTRAITGVIIIPPQMLGLMKSLILEKSFICPNQNFMPIFCIWSEISVTLTFYQGTWLLKMTSSQSCKHLCQAIWKSIHRFRRYRAEGNLQHIWPLTSNCDLDLGRRAMVIDRDTSSHHDKHLCQTIWKSIHRFRRYRAETNLQQTDRQTDRPTSWLLYIPHQSLISHPTPQKRRRIRRIESDSD